MSVLRQFAIVSQARGLAARPHASLGKRGFSHRIPRPQFKNHLMERSEKLESTPGRQAPGVVLGATSMDEPADFFSHDCPRQFPSRWKLNTGIGIAARQTLAPEAAGCEPLVFGGFTSPSRSKSITLLPDSTFRLSSVLSLYFAGIVSGLSVVRVRI